MSKMKVSSCSVITTQPDNKSAIKVNFIQKQESLVNTTWITEHSTLVLLIFLGSVWQNFPPITIPTTNDKLINIQTDGVKLNGLSRVRMYFISVVNYKRVSWMSRRQFYSEPLKSYDKYVDQDSDQYLPEISKPNANRTFIKNIFISKLNIEREHIKLREQTTAARMAANDAHNNSASLRCAL
uniref:Uncharacterized protein n=1 Tax=Glossina pallidipes TaxID=7398 RepID=A0A1A9Z4J2_GLOPL